MTSVLLLAPLQATEVFWTRGICREVQAAASRFLAVPDSEVRMMRTVAAAQLCSVLGSDHLPPTTAVSSTDQWLPSIKTQSQSSPGTGTTSALLSADMAEASLPCHSYLLQHSSHPLLCLTVFTLSAHFPK